MAENMCMQVTATHNRSSIANGKVFSKQGKLHDMTLTGFIANSLRTYNFILDRRGLLGFIKRNMLHKKVKTRQDLTRLFDDTVKKDMGDR
jgi:hypothetical protein